MESELNQTENKILLELEGEKKTIYQLCGAIRLSFSTINQTINIMREKGLVDKVKAKQKTYWFKK
jgi:predicted transcriptional regulator